MLRVYRITVRNRAAAAALGVGAIVAGGLLLALGLTLVAGMTVIGLAAAGGAMLYRRLAGRPPLTVQRGREELDPRLEVYPARAREVMRLRGGRAH